MKTKRKLWSGNKRFRLLLTLELAVMLPAAALIYVNFHHLKSIERDKRVEATIHRDFLEMLAISEKKINQKMYDLTEEVKDIFPNPDIDTEADRTKKLESILSERPWLGHAFLFDAEKGLLFQSQPHRLGNEYFRWEHDRLAKMYGGWLSMDSKMVLQQIRKKSRAIQCYTDHIKRSSGYVPITTAMFTLPGTSEKRIVIGGVTFDPDYLTGNLFPEMLEELTSQRISDQGGSPTAMMIYTVDSDGGYEKAPLVASTGWGHGKAEVTRNLNDVFSGLGLGIKFQGTTVEAMGRRWVTQSFLILGALSLLLVGGLVLTYRSVNKEVSLARLKSDFVSNVSHELRTPLALIRLYAETLELGRIKTEDKKEEYYRIIRKESERLTALINNILDFSRIEAGGKEYDFRETDVAELVRSTLDAYRFQIEQQGFALEENIETNIPAVRVDREAIARSLVNLVNNALKYSAGEKFLGVKLYRSNGVLKLEVIDRGIGIARSEQEKIFEKFYRTGDPLVHNSKGSGLGLSLVRHIARAHGGEVEVESTPGKGSKFTLLLPLVANHPTSGAVSEAT
jgi:signal transduction histidine kinase